MINVLTTLRITWNVKGYTVEKEVGMSAIMQKRYKVAGKKKSYNKSVLHKQAYQNKKQLLEQTINSERETLSIKTVYSS